MSLNVEGLGTMVANTGVFATLVGGEQPSAVTADQSKLTIFSQNEDTNNPGNFIDTEIDLNNNGVTFKLPTNDTNSQLSCHNSDGDKLLKLYAGPAAVTTTLSLGAGAGVGSGSGSLAIGTIAGATNQSTNAIAVGANAGTTSQGSNSVAVGANAGQLNQGNNCTAVGGQAGVGNQGDNSVAIGRQAGFANQGTNSVAIGFNCGKSTQRESSIAIGFSAGINDQLAESVAIGYQAGETSQGIKAVTIGSNSSQLNQSQESISIGHQSCVGDAEAGDFSTSIGSQTKHEGAYGVSLGYKAGFSNGSVDNTFYIGMDGYVDPATLGQSCMRAETSTSENSLNSWRLMALNTSTGEIKYLTGLSNQALNPGTVEPLTMDITTGQIGHD